MAERGPLQDRQVKAADADRAEVVVPLSPKAARLEAARALEPSGKELHDRRCWRMGRDAAVAAFERAGIPGAMNEWPPRDQPVCNACFLSGRDAVIKALDVR